MSQFLLGLGGVGAVEVVTAEDPDGVDEGLLKAGHVARRNEVLDQVIPQIRLVVREGAPHLPGRGHIGVGCEELAVGEGGVRRRELQEGPLQVVEAHAAFEGEQASLC